MLPGMIPNRLARPHRTLRVTSTLFAVVLLSRHIIVVELTLSAPLQRDCSSPDRRTAATICSIIR